MINHFNKFLGLSTEANYRISVLWTFTVLKPNTLRHFSTIGLVLDVAINQNSFAATTSAIEYDRIHRTKSIPLEMSAKNVFALCRTVSWSLERALTHVVGIWDYASILWTERICLYAYGIFSSCIQILLSQQTLNQIVFTHTHRLKEGKRGISDFATISHSLAKKMQFSIYSYFVCIR